MSALVLRVGVFLLAAAGGPVGAMRVDDGRFGDVGDLILEPSI